MINFKINNRQFLSATVVFFYLIPLFFFASYSIGLMSRHKSWTILSLGLLLTTCGALILIFLLYYWEQSVSEKVYQRGLLDYSSNASEKETKVTALDAHLLLNEPISNEDSSIIESHQKETSLLQANLKDMQVKYEHLLEEMQAKAQALCRQEEDNKLLIAKAEQITQDFSDYKIFSEEQLKQKNLQILSFQRTIEEQRSEMEKHQEQIQLLDTKVHDLSYEIKTLLYLTEAEASPQKPAPLFSNESIKITQIGGEESHSKDSIQAQAIITEEANPNTFLLTESQIKTPTEAATLLRRCINIAQKLTGANYYGNEFSRYREMSSPYYTIDQRRLFDSLRSEVSGLVFVYSQKDSKLIFVNNQSRTLLGWNPEKFIQDFSLLIQEGSLEWKRALGALASYPESQARLLIKTKNGQELLVNCHIGLISSGLFKNYVIGVLYPA